jgi:WD40 repeat protein
MQYLLFVARGVKSSSCRGLLLLLLLLHVSAGAAEQASIPYKHRAVGVPTQVGPVDAEQNAVFLGDANVVHLVDLATRAVLRSFDMIPGMYGDKLNGYACLEAERRLLLFQDSGVVAWDWDTGLVVEEISGAPGYAYPPSKLLPDGSWVYLQPYPDGDGLYRYVPETGVGTQLLAGKQVVRLSHDGSHALVVAATKADNLFEVYDSVTETLEYSISLDSGINPAGVVLSPDGGQVATLNGIDTEAGPQLELLIYDLEQGRMVKQIPLDVESIDEIVTWSPSGVLMEDAGYIRGRIITSATLVTLGDVSAVRQLEVDDDVLGYLSVSPNGEHFFCTSYNFGQVETYPALTSARAVVVDLAEGGDTTYVPTLLGRAGALASSNDGAVLNVDAPPGNSAWNPDASLRTWIWGGQQLRTPVSMSADGQWSCSCWGYQCMSFRVMDLDTGQTIYEHPYEETQERYLRASFSRDGSWVMVNMTKQTYILRTSDWGIEESFAGSDAVAFSGHDAKELLIRTETEKEGVRFSGAPFDDLENERFSVSGVDFVDAPVVSGDGARLYGVRENTYAVREIAVADGAVRDFPIDTGEVPRKVAVSGDGDLLAVVTPSQVQIINHATGAVQRRIAIDSGYAPLFSPDGKWLLVSAGTVTQWPTSLATCDEECAGDEQDTDADGLSDCFERCGNTRPWEADSDGDFVPDGAELTLGLDPAIAEISADTDSDGLPDSVEAYLGTDASSTDTDGDGALDRDELVAGTDPTVSDQQVEGEGEGVSEGTAEGVVEGMVEGVPTEGEGVLEGISEGQQEGDGVIEGEGEPEGSLDGEGVSEGEGALEGALEGEVVEGEGGDEGEGVEEGEGEGTVEPPLPFGCNCQGVDASALGAKGLFGEYLLFGALALLLLTMGQRTGVAGRRSSL